MAEIQSSGALNASSGGSSLGGPGDPTAREREIAGALNTQARQQNSKDILDAATARLMRDLDRLPYRAAMAAGFDAPGVGSGLGRVLSAQLATDLATRGLPFHALRQRAQTELEMTQARQAELQQRLNEQNYDYYSAPFGANPTEAGFAAMPTAPMQWGGDRTPDLQTRLNQLGGELPAAGTGTATAPGATALSLSDGRTVQVTAGTAQQLRLLQARLDRALFFSGRAPAARDDVLVYTDKMNELLRNDPLAKQHLELAGKSAEADIGFTKEFSLRLADYAKESYQQAAEELKAMAAAGNLAIDPAREDEWIHQRANQIYAGKRTLLADTLRGMGKDPTAYLGADEDIASSNLPSLAPAPGEAPPAAPEQESSSPFTRKPPTREEELKIAEYQAGAAQNLATLEQADKDLSRALKLNETALAGSDWTVWAEREGRRLWGRVRGEEDPTLAATAELESILAGETLKNLQQLKGNPTEGERRFIQQLSGSVGMSRAERAAVIRRAQVLLHPRLEFERARNRSAKAGKMISARDYETWLRNTYGDDFGDALRQGDERALDELGGGGG